MFFDHTLAKIMRELRAAKEPEERRRLAQAAIARSRRIMAPKPRSQIQ